METIKDNSKDEKVSLAIKLIEKMPSLPQVIINIQNMLRDETTPAKRLALELTKDPILAAETLRIVNSPLYGFITQVTSLEQAVVILGTKTISRLVTVAWSKRIMMGEQKGYGQQRGENAVSSLIGGYAAKKVAEISGLRTISDIIFTSAVLRNIGKIALDALLKDRITQIFEKVRQDRKPFWIVEREIFGFDHSELGYMIAQKWNLPKEICLTIRYFHWPSSFKGENIILKIISCAHIGDTISMMVGDSSSRDSMLYQFDTNTFSILGIKEEDFYSIAQDTASSVEDIKTEIYGETKV